MLQQSPRRRQAVGPSPVDELLGAIRDLSQLDPPPAIRERLSVLAAQRLRGMGERTGQFAGFRQRYLFWFKPAMVLAFLVALSIAGVFFVHLRRSSHLQVASGSKVVSHPAVVANSVRPSTAAHLSAAPRPRNRHLRPKPPENVIPQQMTIWLPYSDSAVVTGTATTIQVSMSPSDLLSLGFPVSQVYPDRWVVAELTVGADGLPRAVSLPLPLEVIKERK